MSAALRGSAVVAGILVAGGVFGACGPFFDGPYPCLSGYTSCAGTQNQCETQTGSDPFNCGSCGATCPQGAVCQNGSCGAAPTPIANTLALTSFAINDTDVFFWSSNGQNAAALEGMRKSGSSGASFAVMTGYAAVEPDGLAADDSNVYYWASSTGIAQADILSVAAPMGGDQVDVAELGTNLSGGTTLLLAGGTLVLVSTLTGIEVQAVPATANGAMPTTVATGIGSLYALAIDAANLYTTGSMVLDITQESSSCVLASTPLSGGGSTTALTTVDTGNCPTALASDGANLYYASSFSSSAGFCTLQVASIPVAGGTPAVVASFSASETPVQMVVDGSNLYVATGQSVWRVSTSDGTSERVVGGLSTSAPGCLGGVDYTPGPPVAIAVDDASLFVSVCPSCATVGSGGLLFQVPK